MLPLPPPPSSSSSSSSSSRHNYDVFLSFGGEDTRKNFTDHLHAALKRKGILTFRDDPNLEAGKEIASGLVKAIQESWCSLIVFSETYAFSRWCLDELAEIVQQKRERGHQVFPIFYDVDPSDLRNQTGKLKEAFAKHEERYKQLDKNKTQKWRAALIEVANVKGWHLKDSPESDFIEGIVRNLSIKLCVRDSDVPGDLVGIDSRLEELLLKIDIEKDGVRIIGICGMGGLGKTTLATVVYNQLSSERFDFDGTCFLADVRGISENRALVSLQKELLSQILLEESFPHLSNVDRGKAMIHRMLSHKKVLVVIDDVDHLRQLQCLVGGRDWFGPRSRIIITSRDQHLLRSHKVDDVYEPPTFDENEALQLFYMKAFKSDTVPNDGFIELSKRVVRYADGLPLALEVLGSFLCGRDEDQWRSAIERLERDSNKDIIDRLRIGFDGLEESEKNIFLDIACFFNNLYVFGGNDYLIDVLDGCGFYPHVGLNVLFEKSLITYDGNNIWMHHLLQEMGRKIVRQKSPEPGKRCRLWEEEDFYHVLTNDTATEAIEGVMINLEVRKEKYKTLSADALLKMKRLRLLKLSCFLPYDIGKHENIYNFFYPLCSHDLNYLSNELRVLEWSGYPFRSLPSSFEPVNLVVLRITYSRIERLWKDNTDLPKLKFVDFKGCVNLIETLDFTMAPNLESMNMEGCSRVVDVHPSVGVLKKLTVLNLKGCKNLSSLPTSLRIESLETCILSGCSNLQRFPEIGGEMKCLLLLLLDGAGIEELPSSIGHLSNLVLLNLKDCSNLIGLPSSIGGCKCLKTLNLSGCSKVETLPENLQLVEFLEELDLSGTAIARNMPSFIFQLKNLINLSGCKESIALMLPHLSGLTSLRKLDLSDCNLGEYDILSYLCCLSSLEELDLSGNDLIISLPASLGRLPNLNRLNLLDCKNLKSLPESLTSIEDVNIDGCASLEVIEDPTTKKYYKERYDVAIRAGNCYKLGEKNKALTFLKKHLKVHATERGEFDIVVPGSEIPKWFIHQTDETCTDEESYISIEKQLGGPTPTNGNENDSRWVGFAFCCLFVPLFTDDDYFNIGMIISNTIDVGGGTYGYHSISDKYWRQVRKDHLWLGYSIRDDEPKCNEVFKFTTKYNSLQINVKKCGVRPVYEKDLED